MAQEISEGHGEQEAPATDAQVAPVQGEQEIEPEPRLEPSDFMPQLRPKPKWPRILGWTLLIVIVLAAIGAGAWQWDKHKNASVSSHKTQHETSASRPATPSTKTYTSNDFNLTLTYPQDWNLVDNGKLTVTSPEMQFKAADGQSQNGEIILSIEDQSSADMSAFDKGSAVAVLASQKVSYTKPTSTQLGSTYVSFLQYAATTTHGALDGVYVTGNYGYEYGQVIPESDITNVTPLIRATFVACQNAKCTTTKPLSIASTEWNDASFSTPIINIIKSLQLN